MHSKLILSAGLLLIPLVASGQTYDMRKLAKEDEVSKAGDGVFEEIEKIEDAKQTISVEGHPDKVKPTKKHLKITRTVTIAAVDDMGKSIKTRVEYHSFDQDGSKSGPCEIVMDKADGKWSISKTSGEPSPELKAYVQEKLTRKNRDRSEDDKFLAILSAKPVSEGDTWKISASDVKKMLEGKFSDKSKFASTTGTGKFVSAKKEGSTTLLELDIKLRFEFSTFEGIECIEPVVISMSLRPRIAIDNSPRGGMNMSMTMTGLIAPKPGVTVRFDMKVDETKRTSPPK